MCAVDKVDVLEAVVVVVQKCCAGSEGFDEVQLAARPVMVFEVDACFLCDGCKLERDCMGRIADEKQQEKNKKNSLHVFETVGERGYVYGTI